MDLEEYLTENTHSYFNSPDYAYCVNVPDQYFKHSSFFVVIGINHVKTGLSRYDNVVIYDAGKILAIESFNSVNVMENSVEKFLPNHEHTDKAP